METNKERYTDDELVVQFQHGDKTAFEQLVYRYKNSLYQYILSLVKDEGAAGDLFQEVFISFFKHIDSYKAQGKFKAWLFLAARNKVINYWRDTRADVSLDQTDEDGKAFLQEVLPDDSPLPLESLTGEETLEQIRKAADLLPPRQREVIELRQYLSFQEIADLLKRPLGTVLADCHRAVKKMQQLLRAQQVAEENL